MPLTHATGAILGLAVGDALGAPYEFTASPDLTLTREAQDMTGGGGVGWQPGEWTDDTSMAVPILREVAAGADLLDSVTQDRLVLAWRNWARIAPDVGIQTRRVLSEMTEPTAEQAREQAWNVHREAGRSAGNGSLMRTAPVALAYAHSTGDCDDISAAARALSDLTHFEADAGDACALWTVAIWRAVRGEEFALIDQLEALPSQRRDRWRALLGQAEDGWPPAFPQNGWVVHALQAAWAAVHRAGLNPADRSTLQPERLPPVYEMAINAGNDTDTVAAIAGSLAGALVGADAVPSGWLEPLHGWPDLDAASLTDLAVQAHGRGSGA